VQAPATACMPLAHLSCLQAAYSRLHTAQPSVTGLQTAPPACPAFDVKASAPACQPAEPACRMHPPPVAYLQRAAHPARTATAQHTPACLPLASTSPCPPLHTQAAPAPAPSWCPPCSWPACCQTYTGSTWPASRRGAGRQALQAHPQKAPQAARQARSPLRP
jgi:hypothetical protein